MRDRIRVAVFEQDRLTAAAIGALLERDAGCTATTCDGMSTEPDIEVTGNAGIDVAVVDTAIVRAHPVEIARLARVTPVVELVRSVCPACPVLRRTGAVMNARNGAEETSTSCPVAIRLRAGCCWSLVSRYSVAEVLLDAVWTTARRSPFVDPNALEAGSVSRETRAIRVAVASLTPRERAVAELLCRGLTNVEISESLSVAVKTVDNHVAAILTKLGCHRRATVAFRYAPALCRPDNQAEGATE